MLSSLIEIKSSPFLGNSPWCTVHAKNFPFGIECGWIDGFINSGDWVDEARLLIVRAKLPHGKSPVRVQLRKGWQNVHTYVFKVTNKKAAAVGALDLIRRLLDEACFDAYKSVPVYFGWDYLKANKNIIDVVCVRDAANAIIEGENIETLSEARHLKTLYDYEWQTGACDRDSSKAFWNALLREIKND